jgi:hypothetical protein
MLQFFFGMNTREINGSAWPFKFYCIAAAPFVVITIIFPITALPTFRFLVSPWPAIQRKVHRRFLISTFIFELLLDILTKTWVYETYGFSITTVTLQMLLYIYAICIFVYKIFSVLAGEERTILVFFKHYWRWNLFSFLLLVVFYSLTSFSYS